MDDDSAHRPLPPEGIRLAQAHLWITQQRGGEPDRTRTLLVLGVRAKRLRHRVAGWDAKYPQWACRPLNFPSVMVVGAIPQGCKKQESHAGLGLESCPRGLGAGYGCR
jgi:hypothetical protein